MSINEESMCELLKKLNMKNIDELRDAIKKEYDEGAFDEEYNGCEFIITFNDM